MSGNLWYWAGRSVAGSCCGLYCTVLSEYRIRARGGRQVGSRRRGVSRSVKGFGGMWWWWHLINSFVQKDCIEVDLVVWITTWVEDDCSIGELSPDYIVLSLWAQWALLTLLTCSCTLWWAGWALLTLLTFHARCGELGELCSLCSLFMHAAVSWVSSAHFAHLFMHMHAAASTPWFVLPVTWLVPVPCCLVLPSSILSAAFCEYIKTVFLLGCNTILLSIFHHLDEIWSCLQSHVWLLAELSLLLKSVIGVLFHVHPAIFVFSVVIHASRCWEKTISWNVLCALSTEGLVSLCPGNLWTCPGTISVRMWLLTRQHTTHSLNNLPQCRLVCLGSERCWRALRSVQGRSFSA